MALLDEIFRFGTIGLFIWLTIWVLRDWRHQIRGKLAVAMFVCMSTSLLSFKSTFQLAETTLDLVLFPFWLLGGVSVWLFCLSQFDDHFYLKPWHWAVVGIKLVLGYLFLFANQRGYTGLFEVTFGVSWSMALAIKAHLAYVTWRGRDDDLMPARLKFRSIFVACVILISIGLNLAEVWYLEHPAQPVPYLPLAQSATFFAITLFVLWRLSGPDGIELFLFSASGRGTRATAPTGEDRPDLTALEALIADKVFLEPGLNIAQLADKAQMPEHRLRRLINQHMGFRNFSDFLNHHRITEAKARLASVDDRHLPVLTIAMDLGYGSLGPFNRAFKERTGQTPTEYRRTAIAAT